MQPRCWKVLSLLTKPHASCNVVLGDTSVACQMRYFVHPVVVRCSAQPSPSHRPCWPALIHMCLAPLIRPKHLLLPWLPVALSACATIGHLVSKDTGGAGERRVQASFVRNGPALFAHVPDSLVLPTGHMTFGSLNVQGVQGFQELLQFSTRPFRILFQ